jgi:predicted RNA methylase
VLAEIIETGMLDEQQVPVLNALRRRGVITAATRLLPATYVTTLELVDADHRYYGFAIAAPKHEWPFYASGPGWHPTPVATTSAAVVTARETNAVRLAGRIGLSARHALGPTHALNGDKILPIAPLRGVARATLRRRYRMGAGLGALELTCVPSDRATASVGGWPDSHPSRGEVP